MADDPYALDRSITAAGLALAAAREQLREDPESSPQRPLAAHDRVSLHEALVELTDRAERRRDEPVWAAAVPWVQALALARATWVDERREEAERRVRRTPIEQPVRAEVTPHEAFGHALRSAGAAVDGGLGAAWARVVEDLAGPVHRAALFRMRRRVEAARRLGDVDRDALDLPAAEPALAARAAREVLAITDGVVRPAPTWLDAVHVGLAREGQEGYPARPTARWLLSVLPPGAFDGVALAPGALPSFLGASSVARALGRIGAAAAEEDRPPGLPRCLARAPSDLLVARRSALFASLVADPVFARRVLGLTRGPARDQAARAARALALGLRVLAARTLLRDASLSDGELVERGADLVGAALGTKLDPTLVGVVPRLDPGAGGDGTTGAGAALIGAVVAAADRERLVETLDEDWFASPHTADVLRHENHGHRADVRATPEALDAGISSLRRALASA